MKKFLKECSLAELMGLSLYYNNSYNIWFAARHGIANNGVELVHTFKVKINRTKKLTTLKP